MNFAFDIDGTITRHPEQFRAIMDSLKKNGHGVYVLTGSIDPEGALTSDEQWRLRQLENIGINKSHFTELCICWAPGNYEEVGQMKAQFCKKYDVKMIHEDSIIFIEAIKRDSKETATMAVVG